MRADRRVLCVSVSQVVKVEGCVNFSSDRYTCALPKCWQSRSDCPTTNYNIMYVCSLTSTPPVLYIRTYVNLFLNSFICFSVLLFSLCVCVHACVCACVRACVCVHVCACMCVRACVCVCVCVCVHALFHCSIVEGRPLHSQYAAAWSVHVLSFHMHAPLVEQELIGCS